MTIEQSDPFDADLHQLFVHTHPDVGFEDRLVIAVRQHRRILLSIPAPVKRAAIAAAAVLAVGTVGYYGNRAIVGTQRHTGAKVASTLHQIGLPTFTASNERGSNFGGGTTSAQNLKAGKLPSKPTANVRQLELTFAADEINHGGTKHLIDRLHNTYAFRGDSQAKDLLGSVTGPNYFDGISGGGADSKVGLAAKLGLVSVNQPTVNAELKKTAVMLQEQSAAPNAPSPLVVADARSIDDEPIKAIAPATGSPTTQPTDDRKIIRSGSMEFEVDRFDAAQLQITKIVTELGGFVGATDSQKLPNGKVRGSISVRVPPERLDALVLSLRALGDLKSQQITAQDITKEYTDLQSELSADHAMQDRLLDLIHNGKGSIKDLLAAENELGRWRGKIEKAEGMLRYYNGQVGLSTLAITLSERDIQTPATVVETQTADMGIEAEDVEKARSNAMKLIDDAKGRIVEAELKHLDAGQLAARLVADVPPESTGAVIDQFKQLGKVARLEVNRQQTNSDGTAVVNAATPLRIERKPTRLLISIYNLANVAPRRTTNVSLAAGDVESAYAALVSIVKSNGGRVVTSHLDRGDPAKASGSLVLEIPPEKLDVAMTALHAQGDVLKLSLTENTDTQNSTEAKQGLTVELVSLASVPARETLQQARAASDVPTAYQQILAAAKAAHARVQSAQLNEQDRQNITAELQMEVPRAELENLDKALAGAGGIISRNSTRSAEVEGTVDSKVALNLSVMSTDHLAPRETTRLQIEVSDVDKATATVQAAAIAAGGRVLEATASNDHGRGSARVALDLPLEKVGSVLQQIRSEGTVRGIDSSRDAQAPAGPMAHGQIFVEFGTTDAIVADQTGPWASIRQGLSTSVSGLMWSLQWIVVGLCLIGPWAILGWIGWKLWRRRRRNAEVRMQDAE